MMMMQIFFCSIFVKPRGECKDISVHVYFDESIYTDIFLSTFYEVLRSLRLFPSHT